MIRPELAAAARRWREALIGAAMALAGLWAVLGGRGPLSLVGGALLLAGAGLAVAGWQRGRFRDPQAGQGPGIVQIDEGAIAYFGPLTGGAAAIPALTRIELDATGRPTHWVFHHSDGPALHIPVTATNAEALFDALAKLPGLRTEAMLRHLAEPGGRIRTVWARTGGPQAVRLPPAGRTGPPPPLD